MPTRPARRTVEGIRPLEQIRTGAPALQGSARSRIRLRSDPRGSHHRHRAPRAAQLQAAAGQFLSDPVQVPRRDPPALRRDARARVHHEGRLLVPHRRAEPRPGLPRHVRCLHPHLHPHGPPVPRGAGGWRQHRRDVSQEFHVLAESGEDAIVFSTAGDYASNIETAATLPPTTPRPPRRRRP